MTIYSLYSTANDPQPQMILRPQMIPKMDRKWSSTESDPQSRPQMIQWKLGEWNGFYGTDYKKETCFSRLLKRKGRRTLRLGSIYSRRKKKWNKSEKDMVLTVYFFLCQLLQFSFKNVSSLQNLREAGRYAEKTLLFWHLEAEEYKAGHPLVHNKSFNDFTDLFESVKLIFRIFNFDFSLKC